MRDEKLYNRASHFKVTLDEVEVAAFGVASGLSLQLEVLEHPEGGINDHLHKLVGPARWTPVVLAVGSSSSKELFDWIKASMSGDIQRKNGSIIALDQKGDAIGRWNLRHAWPSSYEGPKFDAPQSEVCIERLELSHHGFEFLPEGDSD